MAVYKISETTALWLTTEAPRRLLELLRGMLRSLKRPALIAFFTIGLTQAASCNTLQGIAEEAFRLVLQLAEPELSELKEAVRADGDVRANPESTDEEREASHDRVVEAAQMLYERIRLLANDRDAPMKVFERVLIDAGIEAVGGLLLTAVV